VSVVLDFDWCIDPTHYVEREFAAIRSSTVHGEGLARLQARRDPSHAKGLQAIQPERLARIGAKVDGRTVLLLADDPPRQIRELLEAFHAGGAVVRDLTLKHASLEEVFLHLTGRDLRE